MTTGVAIWFSAHLKFGELSRLYARCWDIELHFAQIEPTFQMDVLHCPKPAMGKKVTDRYI